jgi:hypothetical protein
VSAAFSPTGIASAKLPPRIFSLPLLLSDASGEHDARFHCSATGETADRSERLREEVAAAVDDDSTAKRSTTFESSLFSRG